jgi:RHS repeat-associated protein
MVTSATGAVLECYDYLPFGRMLGSGINSRNNGCYPANPDTQINSRLPQKFTGKERDSETRLDYFGARYYSAAQGRFTSADAPFADQHPENPQSWNLYQYAYNNPLANVDRDGRSVWTKAIKLLLKGGDIALTVKDVVDDFKTASNVDLPWSTRLLADASILSEVLPISAGDVKDVGRVLGFADKAKDAAQKALKHGDDAAEGLRVIGHDTDAYRQPWSR